MDSTKASCWVNNKLRAHEEQWKEDDCTFCQCVDGEPHCTAMACKQSCQNPVKIPGECCPFCEGTPNVSYLIYCSYLYEVHTLSLSSLRVILSLEGNWFFCKAEHNTLSHIPHVGGSCVPAALLQRPCRHGLIKGEAMEHSSSCRVLCVPLLLLPAKMRPTCVCEAVSCF